MLLCDLHRLARNCRRGLRQGAEDSARVKPTRPFDTEYLFPVDVARPQLRNRGVTSIGTTRSRAHAKTAFSEVETIANRPSNPVELHPLDVRLVHAALINQILDQAADCVLSERSDDRSVHPEATLQAPRDVVFTAAFPDLKVARGSDASFTCIETQHYFTETDDVPAAVRLRLGHEMAHDSERLAGSSLGASRWMISNAMR